MATTQRTYDLDTSGLRASIRGELIHPGDAGYDAARKVYNGMIDRHPALIVRCADVAVVIAVVNFGRENNLLVSIRGGGHNAGGLGVCDDGLVIDLSLIGYTHVDPVARTVRVGGGCTWGDVDHATHALKRPIETTTGAWQPSRAPTIPRISSESIKTLSPLSNEQGEEGVRYDFIIVGAGSAGCVLAARLSEASSRSVLLLEAVPDYHDAPLPPEIASGFGAAFTHDWEYFHEPDQLGRTIHLPRAKLVGGCSATNATFALRGTPGDYDEWIAQGNPGWAFADMLPFFRSLENDADVPTEWHGRSGPLPIRRYLCEELTAVQQTFLQACAELGYAQVTDHNAPGAIGAGPMPMNTIAGVRQSTAQTYLAQARGRPNLTVRSLVLVDRLLFEGRRAIGIRLAPTGETLWADTILLSAGTYNSPMILMRSGLSPAHHLHDLDIPVLEDMPGVGAHLIDHPLLAMRFAAPFAAYAKGRPAFQTLLTLKSEGAITGHDLHIFPHSIFPCGPEESASKAQFMLFIAVMKPHSRGRLHLRSSSPDAPPVIDLGHLIDPRDMRRMLKGLRVARQAAQTAAMSELALQELYPGTEMPETEANLAAAVLAEVESYHHPVGTCRMGPGTDSMAVVDPQGKVHGVEGLWVVDASIMPTIPAANINLPTIVVAERCAAWLTRSKHHRM